MNAIDRVMRAYLSTRNLTSEEVSRVRAELSKFINELMFENGTKEPPTTSGGH